MNTAQREEESSSTYGNGFFKRDSLTCIEIEGRDSGRYLQSRTSNDILGLEKGDSCLTACLSAQGKLEALFTAYCIEPNTHYLFITDGDSPESNLEHLLRFRVADQLTAEIKDEYSIIHFIYEKDANSLLSELSPLHAISSKRLSKKGWDLVVPQTSSEQVSAALSEVLPELSEDKLSALRVEGHRPWFPDELAVGTLFLEALSLNAISSTKGCYPGQEVIEKALARGKPPKLIGSYFSDAPPSIHEKVHQKQEGPSIGDIICTGANPQTGKYMSFARIKSAYQAQPLITESGITLSPL